MFLVLVSKHRPASLVENQTGPGCGFCCQKSAGDVSSPLCPLSCVHSRYTSDTFFPQSRRY